MQIDRRAVLAGLVGAAGAIGAGGWWLSRNGSSRPPNIVLILTDDQGFNDVGCYYTADPDGLISKIETPRLDRMAAEGVRFTDFYVAASVCTPSRAAFMTGCYPPRVGFADKAGGPGVFTPKSAAGLHADETTIAEMLRTAGYATACVGKWHLGHQAPFLPTSQGFDGFYGIPYSNNQRPLPLMRDTETLRMLPDEPPLVGAFTKAAVTFMEQNKDGPFFLYLAHSAPHEPWAVKPEYRGSSARGLYGDVVERIDWSVGQVLDAIARLGLEDDTVVLFASDNGPWAHPSKHQAGSSYPFRGAKAESLEGGVRSPFIVRWPGMVPAGQVRGGVSSALDLFPTFASLAGASLPTTPIDGHDIWPMISTGAKSPYEAFFYFARGRLEAIRSGPWKLMFENLLRKNSNNEVLFNLERDPGEANDLLASEPEVAARLRGLADEMRADLGDGLRNVIGANRRPIGTL